VNLHLLLVTVCMVLATFLTRAAMLLVGRSKPSPRVEAALRFAPVCALAALIAPAIVVRSGAVDFTPGNPYLVAAIAATGYFLWRRSMVGCIVVGMLVVTAFRFGAGG
jgi:branched-subunit amino acid transport protein